MPLPLGLFTPRIVSHIIIRYLCKKSLTMLRTNVTPDKMNYQLSLNLPSDYVGKELEVIVFAKDEGVRDKPLTRKNVSFTVLKTKGKRFKFNREEANEH